MNLPKVTIILLNYNGVKDTLECLESLRKIDYPNFNIVVVDNNSSGDDVEIIKSKYDDFISEIICSKQNLGFSGGNNLGITHAITNGADYVLLLNNDTAVETEFLSVMIRKSKDNPEAGIITCRINYFDNQNKSWYSGGYISKIKASGFDLNLPEDSKDQFCTFASGCNLLIKKEVIEKIGFLDEKYFLYLEDTDFCARTIKNGFKILFTNETKIYHKVCSTTGKDFKHLPLYYSIRNRFYFIKKNYPMWAPISFFYLISTIVIKTFSQINKREYIKIVLKSVSDFISGRMGRTNYFERG